MDTNGSGKLDTYELQPEVTAFIDALTIQAPGLAAYRNELFRLAGFAAAEGFKQGEEALRARFIPVRFDKDAIGISELEGQEAEAFLAGLGLTPESPNAGNGTNLVTPDNRTQP